MTITQIHEVEQRVIDAEKQLVKEVEFLETATVFPEHFDHLDTLAMNLFNLRFRADLAYERAVKARDKAKMMLYNSSKV